MRRAILALLIVLVMSTAATAVVAQEADPTEGPVVVEEGEREVDSPLGEIIPAPNSGAAPQNAGDRGGSLQLAVFGLILLFGVVAVWRVSSTARQTARAREAAASRTPQGRDVAATNSGGAEGPAARPQP